MQPSANPDAQRAEIDSRLRELESLCGTIERALMLRNWAALDTAISDSRRITHALQNAMDEAASVRDDGFDGMVTRRLRYVHAIRENQMTRLQQYHDAVGDRLQLLARWKAALRSMSKPPPPRSRLGSLDRLT